jgi:hypothetical protein
MWKRPEQQEKPPWESPHSKSTNAPLQAWVALAALLAVLVRGNVTVRARHDRPGSAQMVQYLKGEGP